MRRKWITVLILFVGVIPFVAISIVPLLSTVFNPNQSTATPVDTAAIEQVQNQTAELEAQEKGYQLVLEREPKNATALEGLVMARLQLIQMGQREIKSVIQPLQTLAELQPEQTDYSVLLGQAQQQTGDREGAAQTYQRVLAKAPGNLNALRGLVDLYLEQDRPQAAIGLVEETLQQADQANQLQPGTVDISSVKLLLGDIYLNQQQFDDALALFQNLAKENPNDFRPVLAQAMTLTNQGKAKDAAPLYAQAVTLAPPQYKDQIQQTAEQAETLSQPSPESSPE
ncbi:tetratricopeptide repeat protein [Candidatus Synechococcus calcipolaris G9]|uniref:Tetratricopeptide repeat protein n=1 Tax=Candidatus Synechococcus calcipolaris G9 TaxID=1497997 RepID=A0ABT6F205_9SYNE|nr:tetratricopeptide repeat protein [Candidatus Synechococcus calcipolaris]MDG2991813.1 tetratricopeptide repeat protein [Candidatus Synechococcus calcipolaris G9]